MSAVPLLATVGAVNSATGGAAFPLVTSLIFISIFVVALILDLRQHRSSREISVRDAATWSIVWVGLSLAFAGWLSVYHAEDHPEWASLFLTGYVLEKSLSVDNLMVFIAIFRYFRVSSGVQHRILYWGILGALVFRAIFVVLGTGLLKVLGPYAEVGFALFVLWAALQMFRGGDEDDSEPEYESMPLVKVAKRFFPVFPRLVGSRFVVTAADLTQDPELRAAVKSDNGVARWITPALVCLLVIEGSDVMFSFDSVPAVIAVTRDPFIVYTAMIFAVLGLRSLYFIVEALTHYLSKLEAAVIWVLVFIGIKMLVAAAEHWGLQMPWWSSLSTQEQANVSLVVVLSTLSLGVFLSLVSARQSQTDEERP